MLTFLLVAAALVFLGVVRFCAEQNAPTEAWYNRACIYALKGEKEKALIDLARAIELDRKYMDKAKTDEAFDSLGDDPELKRLVGNEN